MTTSKENRGGEGEEKIAHTLISFVNIQASMDTIRKMPATVNGKSTLEGPYLHDVDEQTP